METIRLVVVSLALCLILLESQAKARVPSYLREGSQLEEKADTFIIGGRPALQGEVPYQLSLKIFSRHICGGSLVEVDGLQIGVTAAHCIRDEFIEDYDVVAGDINFADNTGIEKTLHVSRILVHPNWDKRLTTLDNDIAILFLNGSYVLDENINTVPLPTSRRVTLQGDLTVSGWGNLKFEGRAPDELQIVKIPVVNDTECQKAYEEFFYRVSDDMICTAAPEGDRSPCHGDSGGPATANGYLAGIVSWAIDCGYMNGYPSVYTKVSHFIHFIEDAVADYKNSL